MGFDEILDLTADIFSVYNMQHLVLFTLRPRHLLPGVCCILHDTYLEKKLYPHPGGDRSHVPTTDGNLDTQVKRQHRAQVTVCGKLSDYFSP